MARCQVFFDGRSSGGIETENTRTLSNVMCTSSAKGPSFALFFALQSSSAQSGHQFYRDMKRHLFFYLRKEAYYYKTKMRCCIEYMPQHIYSIWPRTVSKYARYKPQFDPISETSYLALTRTTSIWYRENIYHAV